MKKKNLSIGQKVISIAKGLTRGETGTVIDAHLIAKDIDGIPILSTTHFKPFKNGIHVAVSVDNRPIRDRLDVWDRKYTVNI